ncbi:hypothetical protein MMC24_002788 [Lignoscripta atroalba]|nr:hypothetical protein [Lignoscripta atroalba]
MLAMRRLHNRRKPGINYLDLPPEIRDLIMLHLLNETYRYAGVTAFSQPFGEGRELSAQFLSTNRQIHDEAAAILYGSQPMRFNIWTCFDQPHCRDPCNPQSIERYHHLIQRVVLGVRFVADMKVHRARNGRRRLPVEPREHCLAQVVNLPQLKSILVMFFYSGLSREVWREPQPLRRAPLLSIGDWWFFGSTIVFLQDLANSQNVFARRHWPEFSEDTSQQPSLLWEIYESPQEVSPRQSLAPSALVRYFKKVKGWVKSFFRSLLGI